MKPMVFSLLNECIFKGGLLFIAPSTAPRFPRKVVFMFRNSLVNCVEFESMKKELAGNFGLELSATNLGVFLFVLR